MQRKQLKREKILLPNCRRNVPMATTKNSAPKDSTSLEMVSRMMSTSSKKTTTSIYPMSWNMKDERANISQSLSGT